MGTPSAGAVVLVRFPFSDLSRAKLRPAAVLAKSGREDWLLCQITSNPYADPAAIILDGESFSEGALHRTSYARPGKLFTGHGSIIEATVGLLSKESHSQLIQAVLILLHEGFSARKQ